MNESLHSKDWKGRPTSIGRAELSFLHYTSNVRKKVIDMPVHQQLDPTSLAYCSLSRLYLPSCTAKNVDIGPEKDVSGLQYL